MEFVAGTRDAANQLVANLQRAGELIQSFKQVAADRSYSALRSFDLAQCTEQTMSSLRPGLRKSQVEVRVEIPRGILMESYPGDYGQVLTNLFLNAVRHAFDGRSGGTIRIEGRRLEPHHVEIVFADNGRGMTDEVQRQAFNPFFTTRRGEGGTGLGLHIVHNLVTRRLGGRITMSSTPGKGTTFRLVLPLVGPREAGETAMAISTATDR
jgi:signal transduction histidine kinase